ncbi:MAG: alpha/beta hydrolase [Pelagimonas sp.]|jgi:pimeloyl-ACP methyl ester carboxylesterase|nr:alpha/beta hydrolase [Pelagimonas sp.]
MIWTTRPRSDFGALRAIRAGEGPLVLMIHGVGLRAEAWGAQIEALSSRCSVIAVDMPGHGESAMAEGLGGLRDYTDRIVAGLDQPACVIGHSMGAMIALDMGIRYPDKVTGVAALNAIFQRDDAAAQAVQARAGSLDGQSMADPTGTLRRWFGTTPSVAREACHRWLTEVSPAGYRAAYSIFAHEDGPDPQALGQMNCPALFLTGRDEPNSTPQMSEKMAELAPKGQAQIIENAAHMMPMTHAEQVSETLLDFAQRCQND